MTTNENDHAGQIWNDENLFWTDDIKSLPCGSSATYNGDFSYICNTCGAVAGSIGRPRECREIDEKNKMWEILGGEVDAA